MEALPRVPDALSLAEAPATAAEVLLASGRRYEVRAGEGADQLVVRARDGQVLLSIEVGDAGPVLRFSGAEVVLEATRRLTLSAEEMRIETRGDLNLEVGGRRSTRVRSDDRLEAARVEVQASEGGVAVRAMESIRLDGEHIGLNDDPAPAPFAWSALAGEEASP